MLAHAYVRARRRWRRPAGLRRCRVGLGSGSGLESESEFGFPTWTGSF